MNKIIILIMGIFVMAGLVYALATITITGSHLRVSSLQKGLVGHWALDGESYDSNTERITDKTPYENHGTNSGATLTTDQMGQGDRAMYFDGMDDSVALGDISFNQTFTISLWARYREPATSQIMLMSRGTYLTNGFRFGLQPTQQIKFWTSQSGGTLSVGTSTTTIDTWYHVVVTYNGTIGKIYLNGNEKDSDTGTYIFSSVSIGLGTQSGFGGTSKWNGSISDVRIYNRALSADEIDTLYHSYRPKVSSGSLQKGLVLDMPLKSKYTKDETVGSEIMTDRTPYSNDGQNYGATVGSNYTSFDGVDDYVTRSFFPHITMDGTYSVSVWIYWKGDTEIVGHNHQSIWANSASGSDRNGLTVTRLGQLGFQSWDGGAYDGLIYDFSSHQDEWVHITAVQSAGVKTLYVNAESVGTSGNNYQYPVLFFRISMDEIRTGGYGPFHGLVDEIRIYDRALSPSEIKLLYDKGR